MSFLRKNIKFFIFCLSLVTVMLLIPKYNTVHAASIDGTTGSGISGDPLIVNNFKELKAALQADEELYIQVDEFETGVGDFYTLIPETDYVNGGTAIKSLNTKHLTINCKIDCRATYSSALLYSFIDNEGTLYLDGTGTLAVSFNASAFPNAIIFNGGYYSNLVVSGSISLNAKQFAYQVFGRAIENYAGLMTIYSGNFYGESVHPTIGGSVDAVNIGEHSRANEIKGGNFSAYNANHPQEAYGLSIVDAPCVINGGTFNGIKNTNYIESCLSENYAFKDVSTGNDINLSAVKETHSQIKAYNIYSIDSFNLTFETPKPGDSIFNPNMETSNCVLYSAEWYLTDGVNPLGGSKLTASSKFLPGKTYRLHVIVYPNTEGGYSFVNDIQPKFNGEDGTVYMKGSNFVNCYYLVQTGQEEIETVNVEVTNLVGFEKLPVPVVKTEGLTLGTYSWTLIRDGYADVTMGPADSARDGYKYKLHVIVNVETGYTLKSPIKLYINGELAENYLTGSTYANCRTFMIAANHTCKDFYPEEGVEPTCTTNGLLACYRCGICGQAFSDEGIHKLTEEELVVPAAHKLGDLIEIVYPTCSATGMEPHYECSECHKLFNEIQVEVPNYILIIDKNLSAHTYGAWIDEVTATCTTTGVKGHKDCTLCGKHFDESNNEIVDLTIDIDSSAHAYGAWIDEVTATCTTTGVRGHKDCTLCEKHFDELNNEITDLVIGKNDNHDLETEWTGVKDGHYHICKNDGCPTGHDSLIAHTPDRLEATEDYPVKCTVCDYIITPVLNHTHNLSLVPGTKATCSTTGMKDYYKCNGCEEIFEDELGTKKITDSSTLIIPASHSHFTKIEEVKATIDNYGAKAYYKCDDCDTYSKDAEGTSIIPNIEEWKLNEGRLDKLSTGETPTTPTTPETPSTEPKEDAKGGLNGGAIAGIVIGSVVLVAVAAYFALGFTLYKSGKLTGKFFETIFKWIKK